MTAGMAAVVGAPFLNVQQGTGKCDAKADVKALRPKEPAFRRIDNSEEARKSGEVLMKNHRRGKNIVHHTLRGEGLLEEYEIYVSNDQQEMVAVCYIGKDMCGYPGAVHGGVSAALIDNTAGWHYLVLGEKKPGVTAFLNLNYRTRIKADSAVVIHCKVKKVQGRKYFIDVVMKDAAGKTLVDAEALFVQLKPSWTMWIGQKLMEWGF